MSRSVFGLGVAAAMMAVGLSACGGGGGGSSGPTTPVVTTPPVTTPTPTPTFTSWSNDLKPGATATAPGRSQEITFASTSSGPTFSAPSAAGNATYSETVNAASVTTGIQLITPNRTISLNTATGDTIGVLTDNNRVFIGISADQRTLIGGADQANVGWNYQTFGIWITGANTTSGSIGTTSVGAVTAASAIPTSGTATFRGLTGGIYIDAAGIDHMLAGDMTLTADFAARRASFSSATLADVFDRTPFAGTALSGSLTYAAGSNALTGALTTANGRLSGAASGQFFGPSAQEVGGIYTLTGAGNERLIGGFGGKQ